MTVTLYKITKSKKWYPEKFREIITKSTLNTDVLPFGVKISTLGMSGKLGITANIPNIKKYLELSDTDIITIKEGNKFVKTISKDIKVKTKVTKKFENQITLVIRCYENDYDSLEEETKINVKIFTNGSIQMAGCKCREDINLVLNKLLIRLSEVKYFLNSDTKKLEKVTFVDEPELLTTDNYYDSLQSKFKIDLINSNYQIRFKINRTKLHDILVASKIKSSYESDNRPAVIVKYLPPETENEISIFVYQKGHIIITGVKTMKNLENSYHFINDILRENSGAIIYRTTEEILEKVF